MTVTEAPISEDFRVTASIFTPSDVAFLANLDRKMVANWTKPHKSGLPVITTARKGYGPNPPTIPLFGLTDAVAMHSLLEVGVTPRRAAGLAREQKQVDPFFFAREDFLTDGAEFYRRLKTDGIERVRDRQQAFAEVLEPFVRNVTFADGLVKSYVVADLGWDRVIIDPYFNAGRPCLEESKTPIFPILAQADNGENRKAIALDYDLEVHEVNSIVDHAERYREVA